MEKVSQFFERYHLSLVNRRLLVAVSAGPDSMALLDMLVQWRDQRHDFVVIAGHFDHQLRPESSQETKLLRLYCRAHQVPFFNQVWVKKGHFSHGIEARARQARYAFLTRLARSQHCDYLLTAHHGDDLLENILLKLIRSGDASEMNSLQEIGNMHGIQLLRPLLSWHKAALTQYDDHHQISFVRDQTNQMDDTLRNRLRHHVIPLLKQESPDLIPQANRFVHSMTAFEQSRQQLFATIASPERYLPFANFAYWGKSQDLASLKLPQQQLFYEAQIMKLWHRRVHFQAPAFNHNGFSVAFYQGRYALINHSLEPPLPLEKQPITVGQPFEFAGTSYLVSNHLQKQVELGYFYAPKQVQLTVGVLPTGSTLRLANGQQVKAKKKFAEYGICAQLRPYGLALFDDQGAVFVHRVYRRQDYDSVYRRYHVYALVPDKKKMI